MIKYINIIKCYISNENPKHLIIYVLQNKK